MKNFSDTADKMVNDSFATATWQLGELDDATIKRWFKKLYTIVLGTDLRIKNPLYEMHSLAFIRGLVNTKGLNIENGEEELIFAAMFDEVVEKTISLFNTEKNNIKLVARKSAEGYK